MLRFVLTVALAACFVPAAQADEKAGYQLPKDPKAVVISMDDKGGFTPPRKTKDPSMSILRDGTVRVPDLFGLGKDVSGKISEKELQELLKFAIEDNKFFEYDDKKVAAKMKKAGKPPFAIADAATTVVEIRLADKSNKASQYALGFAVNQYKQVDELQQLNAISKRLRGVMNVARLGGNDKLEQMLKMANAQLKKMFPKAAPFTAGDLQNVNLRPDGDKIIAFHRSGKTADGKPDGTYVGATIQQPTEGKPTVQVNGQLDPPKRKR